MFSGWVKSYRKTKTSSARFQSFMSPTQLWETRLDSVYSSRLPLTMLGLIFLLYVFSKCCQRIANNLLLFTQDLIPLYILVLEFFTSSTIEYLQIYMCMYTYTHRQVGAHTHSLFSLLLWREQWFLMNGCLLTEVKLGKIIVNQYSSKNFEI